MEMAWMSRKDTSDPPAHDPMGPDPEADDPPDGAALTPAQEAELWARVRDYRSSVEQLTDATMARLAGFLGSVDSRPLAHERFCALARAAVRLAVEHQGWRGEAGPPFIARAYALLFEAVSTRLDRRAGQDGPTWAQGRLDRGRF